MKIYVCIIPEIGHNGVNVLTCSNRIRGENSNVLYYSCKYPKPTCPFYRSYTLSIPSLPIPVENIDIIKPDDIQITQGL